MIAIEKIVNHKQQVIQKLPMVGYYYKQGLMVKEYLPTNCNHHTYVNQKAKHIWPILTPNHISNVTTQITKSQYLSPNKYDVPSFSHQDAIGWLQILQDK